MKITMATSAIKNMVLSAIILLPLQLNVGTIPTQIATLGETETLVSDEIPPSAVPRVVLLDLEGYHCDIECFLTQKENTIEFMSKTFAIDSKHIYEDLIKRNEDYIYEENNIGRLQNKKGEIKEFSSFEEGLIEYFYDFTKKNPKLVSNKRVPYTGDSEYILNLMKYFIGIYDNVDYTTAASIGAAESGNYKVKYMLNSNNIYVGMSSNGLIKYKNIEYGVLSYIRLLSKNYYGKGLTTLESIGRVYCPTYNENGQKVASSHWVNLVTKLHKNYENSYEVVTIDELVNG